MHCEYQWREKTWGGVTNGGANGGGVYKPPSSLGSGGKISKLPVGGVYKPPSGSALCEGLIADLSGICRSGEAASRRRRERAAPSSSAADRSRCLWGRSGKAEDTTCDHYHPNVRPALPATLPVSVPKPKPPSSATELLSPNEPLSSALAMLTPRSSRVATAPAPKTTESLPCAEALSPIAILLVPETTAPAPIAIIGMAFCSWACKSLR